MLVKQGIFCLFLILLVFLTPFQVYARESNQVNLRNAFLNESFVLTGYCDVRQFFLVDVKAGSQIYGTIKSSWQIFFFIMNHTQFKLADRRCNRIAGADMTFNTGGITAYALNWTARGTDDYYFLFFNRSANDVSVSATFWTLEHAPV